MEEYMTSSEPRVRDLEFAVNQERVKLNGFFKRFRMINLIVLIATFSAVALSFVLLFPLGEVGTTIGFSISIVFLVGAMVYMRVMKNKITRKGNVYIKDYYKITSDFIYGDLGLTDYQQEVSNQLTMEDFTDAKFLKDITRFGARNLITYRLGSTDVKLSDYAAYQLVGKTNKIVFAGKLMVFTNLKTPQGRVIIYRKPNVDQINNASGPSDTEGLTLVEDNAQILIFAENPKDVEVLGKEFVGQIERFPSVLPFVDMTFSFTNQKLTVAISYDDELMSIPLPLEYSGKATHAFKEDLINIHKLISLL